jgi:hypothetical protein
MVKVACELLVFRAGFAPAAATYRSDFTALFSVSRSAAGLRVLRARQSPNTTPSSHRRASVIHSQTSPLPVHTHGKDIRHLPGAKDCEEDQSRRDCPKIWPSPGAKAPFIGHKSTLNHKRRQALRKHQSPYHHICFRYRRQTTRQIADPHFSGLFPIPPCFMCN